jgi:hypothetical protein
MEQEIAVFTITDAGELPHHNASSKLAGVSM